jgi:hypothetical protein
MSENANKGKTKQKLVDEVAYYCAQFGAQSWIGEAIDETRRQYDQQRGNQTK